MKFGNACLDWILPPICPISGEVVEKQGMISASTWHELDFIVDPFCTTCGHPFSYEDQGYQMEGLPRLEKTGQNVIENVPKSPKNGSEKGRNSSMICAICVKSSPEFDHHRSALVYNKVSRQFIMMFKHGDHLYAKNIFLPWLMSAGQDLLPDTDLIIPVPLHYFRLVRRQYNQAAVLAQALSKVTGIPCDLATLTRTRSTASQGHKNAKQREKNVKNAFGIRRKSIIRKAPDLAGKTVLLIDDVYTTGATVNACARALRAAGAKTVNVLTITKTMRY